MLNAILNVLLRRKTAENTDQGRAHSYNSVFFRTIALPWLIFIIAVTFIFTSTNLFQISRNEKKAREERISQSVTSLKKHFLSTLEQAENLVLIVKLSSMSSSTDSALEAGNSAENALYAYSYMQFLNSLKLGYSDTDSIWVAQGNYIYSSDRTRYPASPEAAKHLPEDRTGVWHFGFHPGTMTSGAGGAEETVSYVKMISEKPTGEKSFAFVNIGTPSLTERLLKESGLDAFVITDASGRILLSSDADFEVLKTEDGTWFDSSDNACAFINDEGYGFMGKTLKTPITNETRAGVILSIIPAVLSLMVAVYISRIVTKRMYSPMDDFMSQFETNSRDMDTRATQAVVDSLETMMKDDLSGQVNSIDSSAIPDDIITPQMLSKLKLKGRYVVLAAGIDEPARQNGNADKLMAHFDKLLGQFASRLVEPGEDVFAVYIQDGLVATVITLNSPDRCGELETVMKMLQEMLYAVSSCTVSFGCSQLYESHDDISIAMSEALKAIGCKALYEPGCRIFFEEAMFAPSTFIFPKARFQKLVQSFERETPEEIRKQYRAFMESVTAAAATADDLMLVYYQILGQIVQTQIQKGIRASDVFNETGTPYRYMSTMEFSDHISDWLEEKISLLSEKASDIQPTGNIYIKRFKAYMAAHYMEELLPEDVASNLGISYSYLRRLLSKEMNTSFSAVLLNLRIERVKDLLATTKLSHREIAAQVGFGSEQTLYRIFRQQEGCSPGEWRRTANTSLSNTDPDGNEEEPII